MEPWKYYKIYDGLTYLVEAGAITIKELKDTLSKIGLEIIYDNKLGQEVWTDKISKMVMSRPLSEVKQGKILQLGYTNNCYTGC